MYTAGLGLTSVGTVLGVRTGVVDDSMLCGDPHHDKGEYVKTSSARIFAAAAAVTATGCTAVSGTAVETGVSGPTTTTSAVLVPAAPGDLDPGTNPTSALPEGHGNNVELDPATGGLVESQRLAEFVTLPVEIDPDLTDYVDRAIGTLATPAHVAKLLGDTSSGVTQALTDSGYYAGFSTARSSGRSTDSTSHKIIHAVLVFPDADSARTAAAALHQAQMSAESAMTDSTGNPYGGRLQEHPIAELPDSSLGSIAVSIKLPPRS